MIFQNSKSRYIDIGLHHDPSPSRGQSRSITDESKIFPSKPRSVTVVMTILSSSIVTMILQVARSKYKQLLSMTMLYPLNNVQQRKSE